MARVEIATQAWGQLVRPGSNQPLAGAVPTINTTVFAAATGTADIAPASWISDADGLLPGFVESGTYVLVEPDGQSRQVEAIAASSTPKLDAANEFTGEVRMRTHLRGGRFPNDGGKTPDLHWDNSNWKLYTKGLILGDIGDTPDLGMRRAGPDGAAFDAPAAGLGNEQLITRIYWQAYGDNGAFPADWDTPTSGQHQAAFIAAQTTQATGAIATTIASGAAAGSTTIALTSTAGFATEGKALVAASDGNNHTVSYTGVSGNNLTGVTGLTVDAYTGSAVTVFLRGTQLTFNTTPNGNDTNRQVMTLGQNGLLSLKKQGIQVTVGNVDLRSGFMQMTEIAAPSAPSADTVVLYAQDNGAGKTRLVAKFASGADVVLATQA